MLTILSALIFNLKRRWYYPLVSLIMVGTIVVTTPQPSQGISLLELLFRGVQLMQISNLSDSQEMQLGAQIDQGFINQGLRISRNVELTNYVNRIGQNVARNSRRPNLKYIFRVVEDNNINAFTHVGGYIYVNTGLLKAADNEAQVAGVIGHEVGHIVGRHSLNQIRQSMIAQGISAIAGVDRNTIVQVALDLGLRRPKSRQDEYEADRFGLENIIRTGYAPSGMPEFMKKLQSSSSPPEFLSTHPAVPERVNRLQQMIPTEYKQRTEGLDSNIYKQQIRTFLQ
jgi:predicted Zn-dependent protease